MSDALQLGPTPTTIADNWNQGQQPRSASSRKHGRAESHHSIDQRNDLMSKKFPLSLTPLVTVVAPRSRPVNAMLHEALASNDVDVIRMALRELAGLPSFGAMSIRPSG
jgi:hypothetical protein